MSGLPSGYSEPESFEHYVERNDKYIEELQIERDILKAKAKMLLELSGKRFNEGLQLGRADSKRAEIDYLKARNNLLSENERMTNLLLSVEDERDVLKARIDGGTRIFVELDVATGCFTVPYVVPTGDTPNATLILDNKP